MAVLFIYDLVNPDATHRLFKSFVVYTSLSLVFLSSSGDILD